MTFFERLAAELTTPERLARMRAVLDQRTARVLPVFENLNHRHNISAVLRTCEALGMQRVHLVDTARAFELNREVTQGSHEWLDIETWPDTASCLDALAARGYVFAATTLRGETTVPDSLPLDRPLAVLFGNELAGLSEAALARCVYRVRVPMHGFVESFNVSVAAALVFSRLLERLRAGEGGAWRLPPRERARTWRRWLWRNTRVGKVAPRLRAERGAGRRPAPDTGGTTWAGR